MAEDQPLISELAEVPFFKGMTPEQIKELKTVSTIEEHPAGSVIFEEGEVGSALNFVLEGVVEVRKRYGGKREQVLTHLGKNAFFGELAFVLEEERSSTVKALTEARIMQIRRREFNLLLNAESKAAFRLIFNLLVVLAGRLKRMDAEVAALLGRIEDGPSAPGEVDVPPEMPASGAL